MPSLGGSLMVCHGLKFDFPFLEAIESMVPVCDQIALTFFSGEDLKAFHDKFGDDKKFKIAKLDESRFDNDPGKRRLATWKNFTIDMLTTEWNLNLEADEILHEATIPEVLEAIEKPNEGYLIRRVNLWGDCYHYINYPLIESKGRGGELPCSNHVRRLCKTKYRSHPEGDAESIDFPNLNTDYAETIRTYHMSFVRDQRMMLPAKIFIQEKVFDLGYHDPRFDDDLNKNGGKFNPYTRFSREDLLPVTEPLPKVIQAWATSRHARNFE